MYFIQPTRNILNLDQVLNGDKNNNTTTYKPSTEGTDKPSTDGTDKPGTDSTNKTDKDISTNNTGSGTSTENGK